MIEMTRQLVSEFRASWRYGHCIKESGRSLFKVSRQAAAGEYRLWTKGEETTPGTTSKTRGLI